MRTTLVITVIFGSILGCSAPPETTSGGGAPCAETTSISSTTSTTSGAGGSCPAPEPLYPNGISPIIGAEIERIGRGIDPAKGATYKAITEPLFASAANTASSPEVEARRALYAIDDLTRTYVSAWVDAAGIAPASWRDTLPGGRLLTPEEASVANTEALFLIMAARRALPPQAWDGELDAMGRAVHAAVMQPIPGLPQEWHGADEAFRIGWETTGVLGAKAGAGGAQEALGLAQQQVGPGIGAAAFAAVAAMISIGAP